MFQKSGGRVIFFEGTYSTFLASIEVPTPRYNYNQIMYKLDLSDPRLVLPVPVYRWSQEAGTFRFAARHGLLPDQHPEDIAFFALDRPKPEAVPVFAERTPDGRTVLKVSGSSEPNDNRRREPLFYALPAEMEQPPKTTVLLHEYTHQDGPRTGYWTADRDCPTGYQRSGKPLCRVWKNPISSRVTWQ
jgi:hypothetical protein